MGRFFRAWAIVWVVLRYGLDELVLSSFQHPWLSRLRCIVTFGRKLDAPRGQRLRQALEELGPIFVKFGQVLSTRRDLLPPDVAVAMAAATTVRAPAASVATPLRLMAVTSRLKPLAQPPPPLSASVTRPLQQRTAPQPNNPVRLT